MNSFWAPLKHFRKVHKIQIIFRILVSPQFFCAFMSTYSAPWSHGNRPNRSHGNRSDHAPVHASLPLLRSGTGSETDAQRSFAIARTSEKKTPPSFFSTTTSTTTTYIHPYAHFTHLHTIWIRRRSSSELTESCSSDFGGVLSEEQLWRGLR